MVFGFLNERLIFYELFCEGPSALRKYVKPLFDNGIQNIIW